MESKQGIPYRLLGNTGEKVSIVGLGGWHIGAESVSETDSIEIVRTAIDNGVNFMDNSWDYNDGASEIRMGKALKSGYRSKAFVASKVNGQTKGKAKEQFKESLTRLGVDYIDLFQFHEIGRLDDADYIFGPGGGIEAALEAKQAGLARFIGFTGHNGPDFHLRMLEVADRYGFQFDTVLMPLNVMDPHSGERSFERRVLPVARDRGVGVTAIKSLGDSHVLRSKLVSPIECLHFAMNLPISTVITGCESLERLNQALEAARTFRPLSQIELDSLLARTSAAGSNAEFEPYKTDLTAEFNNWIGFPQWYRPE
jgi:aryl-alcohol dehydrogenase-like predicted oxidoreductase